MLEVLRLSGRLNVDAIGDMAEGTSGEKPRVEVDCLSAAETSGESGGVGSLRTNVGTASSSKWKGRSRQGDLSGMVNTRGMISP